MVVAAAGGSAVVSVVTCTTAGGVAGGWATGAETAGGGAATSPGADVWGCRRVPAAPVAAWDLGCERRWTRRVASCAAPVAAATWTPALIG